MIFHIIVLGLFIANQNPTDVQVITWRQPPRQHHYFHVFFLTHKRGTVKVSTTQGEATESPVGECLGVWVPSCLVRRIASVKELLRRPVCNHPKLFVYWGVCQVTLCQLHRLPLQFAQLDWTPYTITHLALNVALSLFVSDSDHAMLMQKKKIYIKSWLS